MARYAYERLSIQDASFLAMEGPTTPMHVSAVQIFESGPLAVGDGGIDIEAIRTAYESILQSVPRYRQKLKWIPIAGRPVWVDDEHFQLDYHIRHVALPHPGGLDELKRMAARVIEHELDRNRPLWELWVVEGLTDGHFAIIAKTHHCMVDGSSGVELAQKLLSPTPQISLPKPRRFIPRRPPTDGELLRDEVIRRMTIPLKALEGIRVLRDEVDDLREEVTVRLKALADILGTAFSPASQTPLNGELSPHRKFDWYEMPLEDVKKVRRALECTVNDVVLGVVTEVVRRYLLARQVDPRHITFRISAPVNVRSDHDRDSLGNRVSTWLVELPVGQPDRLEQVRSLREQTQELKRTRNALGMDVLMSAAEFAPMGLISQGMHMASGPINTIVTNVPGPQFPLYMLGAKLVSILPQVPLLPNIGLGIALMSYDGRMFWGFISDYELVPDVDEIAGSVQGVFADLARAAGVDLEAPDESEPASRALPRPVPAPMTSQ
jgi:WS/DGAT/MGAT family acyltransferase